MRSCFHDKNEHANECLLATYVKVSMVHWHDRGYPWMLKPCLCCLSRCLLPLLYTFCLCAFSLSLSTSLPLHLQFQPFVQLVGWDSQEACSGGSTRECQVQCTHCSDSAVHQEEEQHPAAAAQWQEQSLWFPQWGVSMTVKHGTDLSFCS